jgi:hypothetical protein
MKTQWKFALVLLVGIGLASIGFEVLAINEAAFTSNLASNGLAQVPQCNLLNSRGCVTWPYEVLALAVPGMLMIVAGLIGLVETAFPRREL